MARPLTKKQWAFIEAYSTLGSPTFGNGTASARAAGYGGDDNTLDLIARENRGKPRIAAELEKRRKEHMARNNLTVDKVLEDIERRGNKAENLDQLSTALKASELQGKHLKMWSDRSEQTATSTMTDEEVDETIAALEREIAELKRARGGEET